VTVSTEQIRDRLAAIHARRRHYEWKSEQPGRLTRHEVWRHAYMAHPYLVGAPDKRVAERFCSVFMNVVELGPDGRVQPVPMTETDEYMQVFTHLLEEYGCRTGGHPPNELIAKARAPIVRYFEHGIPRGVTMFEGYRAPTTPLLVKYGKRQFLEPMFRTGELRLANAALYNQAGLLDSVRDDETSRTFFIPTYKERLKGKTNTKIRGHTIEFGDDDIMLPLVFDDYYLFSLCERIHHRMASDFDADTAIVIRDPERFKRRLAEAFFAHRPGWQPMSGAVTYYDPYRDYSKFRVPEMAKHFGYAYQREFRIVFRARRAVASDLEPLFLSVGPMAEYADLVPAKTEVEGCSKSLLG
jgi:hypothetical protein